MTSPNWKQVTAAECLKWRVENPGKEAQIRTGDLAFNVRFNENIGCFEWFNAGVWECDSLPGDPGDTYFIFEVTE